MEVDWIKGGGVTSAKGFTASGVVAGIKPGGKKDMALVASDRDCVTAGVFTTNKVKAAPVKLSMQHLRGGKARAVILNSGNANACTGVRGIQDAARMALETGRRLGCPKNRVLVCSTGRIGVPLPLPKIVRAITKLVDKLSPAHGRTAAKAIMTSDTYPKSCAIEVEIDGKRVLIGGMAKGAGMIHPNMATMLSVITTDAAIDRRTLQDCLVDAVAQSFNRISVDGDTSTNDTVLVLASGEARNRVLQKGHPQLEIFQKALNAVTRKLARLIIEDGEGITRVVELVVQGASSSHHARMIAEAIARSPLVKSSWAGGDPNWGRLMDVIGYSGARMREEMIDIYYDGLIAVKGGTASRTPMARLRKIARNRHYRITIDLHLGRGTYDLLVNDLTEMYVTLNKGE
ncbi:MAG: bifunctional glutamate N-acetyltransferase/amino-acid acetyltransferase ArgJ [Candidatus Methylacidiphilales bacterium]|nr:bifunctional glutamate N-acetyltransferase/amino-acid acetyltransferase ArgJ [Candidatus Methylacidiphilales bacterium]